MWLRVINTKLVEQEMLISLLKVEVEEMEKIWLRSYVSMITS